MSNRDCCRNCQVARKKTIRFNSIVSRGQGGIPFPGKLGSDERQLLEALARPARGEEVLRFHQAREGGEGMADDTEITELHLWIVELRATLHGVEHDQTEQVDLRLKTERLGRLRVS